MATKLLCIGIVVVVVVGEVFVVVVVVGEVFVVVVVVVGEVCVVVVVVVDVLWERYLLLLFILVFIVAYY